ncbi:MAG: phage tail tape measure protein [Reichenbachiella sp.]
MGKTLRDEDLVLNIIVNGDRGKKEILSLERAIKATTSELKGLEAQERKLRASGKKDTEQYRAVTAAIDQKNKALVLSTARLKQLREGMDVTKMSVTDLRREISRLSKLRNISGPGTANWKKYDKQLTAVQARMAALKGQAHATGLSLKNMANKFNQYIGMLTAGFATFYAVISGTRRSITDFAEFDDKLADVQKTTGLLREDVVEINEELKSYDTRTAQMQLLGLGRVAGKLGHESKEDVLGFIRAADQIGVALTEDLGGDIEQSINDIGKLVGLFNVGDEFGLEQGLLKVGSAINELGASSEAQEGYIVDFTKRLGGTAQMAKISIADIMGLGATLDQFGQAVEKSGTAVDKIINMMFKDTSEFARIANIDVQEFTELLNKDANEALLTLLEGLNGNEEGMTAVVEKLGDLGIEGVRARGVVTILATKTEELRGQQQLANEAFKEGTSLTEEFSIKNETAAAKLEKARKNLSNLSIELGEKLMPVMTMSVSGFSYFIRILNVLVDFFLEYKKVVIITTASIVAYNLVVQVQVLWTKRAELWTKLLNIQLLKNPWGLVAASIAAVVGYLVLYKEELTATEKVQKKLDEANKKVADATGKEETKLKSLIKIAKDKTLADQERKGAMEELNRISPEYLGNISMETINTKASKTAIDDYITSLHNKAKAEEYVNQLTAFKGQRDTLTSEQSGLQSFEYDPRSRASPSLKRAHNNRLAEIDQEIAAISAGEKKLQDALTAIYAENAGIQSRLTKDTEAEKLAAQEKALAAARALANKYKSEEQLKTESDQEKARQAVILESQSLIEQERAAYAERLKQAGLFGKNRNNLSGDYLLAYDALYKQHMDNLESIDADAMNKEIERKQELYEQSLLVLKTNQAEELAVFEGTEHQKKALLQKHQADQADFQKRHLEFLMSQIQDILSSGEFEGIDLANSILTEEQRIELEARINAIKLQLAAIAAEAAKVRGDGSLDGGVPVGPDNSRDILGMTASGWSMLYANLEAGKMRVQDLANIAGGLIGVWQAYNAYVTAGEQQQLQEFREGQEARREYLQRSYEQGSISHEQYNRRISSLDSELDQMSAEMAYNRAKRDKEVAYFAAIVNTAAGVAVALSAVPPGFGIVLASIIAGIGALQIATIARTPLPDVPGREDGGFIDVNRSQDNKMFRAKNRPGKRGYVHSPTVITGETGTEFIANNHAYNNPSVRPVLDAIDTAQRNGTISSLNLNNLFSGSNGSEASEFENEVNADPTYVDRSGAVQSSDPEVKELLDKTRSALEKLNEKLDRPITAEVSLLGKNGFVDKQSELDEINELTNL